MSKKFKLTPATSAMLEGLLTFHNGRCTDNFLRDAYRVFAHEKVAKFMEQYGYEYNVSIRRMYDLRSEDARNYWQKVLNQNEEQDCNAMSINAMLEGLLTFHNGRCTDNFLRDAYRVFAHEKVAKFMEQYGYEYNVSIRRMYDLQMYDLQIADVYSCRSGEYDNHRNH